MMISETNVLNYAAFELKAQAQNVVLHESEKNL